MRHWRYLKYIIRHKWYVLCAGWTTAAPLWRLIIHDWSKMLPCEWFPYVEKFYGLSARERGVQRMAELGMFNRPITPTMDSVDEAFDRAWLHHQHANPHHWQHWVLREDSGNVKTLRMPEKFVREMVADWAGAGKAITGQWEVLTWYTKNREIIQLHPETRALVEVLLLQFEYGKPITPKES